MIPDFWVNKVNVCVEDEPAPTEIGINWSVSSPAFDAYNLIEFPGH